MQNRSVRFFTGIGERIGWKKGKRKEEREKRNRAEIRGQNTEYRSPMEDRYGRKMDDGREMTDDRRQKSASGP